MQKCEKCGADFIKKDFNYVCEYCGNTKPRGFSTDEKEIILLNSIFAARQNKNFIEAKNLAAELISKNPNLLEAYWEKILSEFGIIFTINGKNDYYSVFHRISYNSILDEPDYIKLIELSNKETKTYYKKEAEKLEKTRKEIIEKIHDESEKTDIFICYKQNDDKGNPTIDRTKARDLYDFLNKQGFKVFLSEITLKDLGGASWEASIFSAIHHSKVFITVSSKKQFLEHKNLKNEWSRYLDLIKKGKKVPTSFIPVYFNMNAYDLPSEFELPSGSIQGMDMSDMYFLENLKKNISRIISQKEIKQSYFKTKEIQEKIKIKGKESVKEDIIKFTDSDNTKFNLNLNNSLENAYRVLNVDKLYEAAYKLFELTLEEDKAEAYYGMFLSKTKLDEEKIKNKDIDLADVYDYKNLLIEAFKHVNNKNHLNNLLKRFMKIYNSLYVNMVKYDKRDLIDYAIILFSFTNDIIHILDKDEYRKSLINIENRLHAWVKNNNVRNIDYSSNIVDILYFVYSSRRYILEENEIDIYEAMTRMLIVTYIKNFDIDKIKNKSIKVIEEYLETDEYNTFLNVIKMQLKYDCTTFYCFVKKVIENNLINDYDFLIQNVRNTKRLLADTLVELKKILTTDIIFEKTSNCIEFIKLLFSYIINFDIEGIYKDYLYFANIVLELGDFDTANQLFNSLLNSKQDAYDALWGIIKCKAGYKNDYELYHYQIDLIKYDEFLTLLNTKEADNYYKNVYKMISNKQTLGNFKLRSNNIDNKRLKYIEKATKKAEEEKAQNKEKRISFIQKITLYNTFIGTFYRTFLVTIPNLVSRGAILGIIYVLLLKFSFIRVSLVYNIIFIGILAILFIYFLIVNLSLDEYIRDKSYDVLRKEQYKTIILSIIITILTCALIFIQKTIILDYPVLISFSNFSILSYILIGIIVIALIMYEVNKFDETTISFPIIGIIAYISDIDIFGNDLYVTILNFISKLALRLLVIGIIINSLPLKNVFTIIILVVIAITIIFDIIFFFFISSLDHSANNYIQLVILATMVGLMTYNGLNIFDLTNYIYSYYIFFILLAIFFDLNLDQLDEFSDMDEDIINPIIIIITFLASYAILFFLVSNIFNFVEFALLLKIVIFVIIGFVSIIYCVFFFDTIEFEDINIVSYISIKIFAVFGIIALLHISNLLPVIPDNLFLAYMITFGAVYIYNFATVQTSLNY